MADADDTRPDDAGSASAGAPDGRSADAAPGAGTPGGATAVPADAPAADADAEAKADAERRLVDLFQATVYSQDDERIGRVGQVYLDDRTQEPNWVTVKSGFFGSKQFFIPLDEADVDGRQIVVPYTKDLVTSAPVTVVDQNLSPEEEDALYAHYNVPGRVPGVETSEDAAASRAAAAEHDPDIPVFDPRAEAERDSLAADLAGGSADASGGAGAGALANAPTDALSAFAKPEPAQEETPERTAPSDETAQWSRPRPEAPVAAPAPTAEPAAAPTPEQAPEPASEPSEPAPAQPEPAAEPERGTTQPEPEPEPPAPEPAPAEPAAQPEPRDATPASDEAAEPPSPLDAFKGLRFGAADGGDRDDRPGGFAELSDLFGPPTTETPVVPQAGRTDAPTDRPDDEADGTDGPSDDASFRRPEEH